MAIYTQSPPPVLKLPDINPAHIAGRFGSIPAGVLDSTTDFNTAMVGLTRTTGPIPNAPDANWQWGGLWTISSEGSGRDGRRHLTHPLKEGEVVVQFWYSTDHTLYSRTGNGKAGFTPWKKRWGNT